MAKATAADAQLILKLYDLRREAEMRKARHWWVVTFWPQYGRRFHEGRLRFGTPENNWLRQVLGYWGMAASLVNHGALNRDLFLEPSFCGEMVLIYAKVQAVSERIAREDEEPGILFGNIESLIMSTKKSREVLKRMEANLAARRKAMAEGAKAS